MIFLFIYKLLMDKINVLVIPLTSSKIHLLERCLNSIRTQFSVNFKYEIRIIVNTLKDQYYKEVLRKYSNEFKIIRTKSCGLPGMGHNSCLKYFKTQKDFTHMFLIDGDDMYYPCAFQRFEQVFKKKPNIDLLHLMLNDRIHFLNQENFNSYKLKFKLQLISAFDKSENWWEKIKLKNPLKLKVHECKTPSRILLASRNIFNTSIPIEYDEELTLYDDMITFFSFYEAELKKEIECYSTSDTYIYLYNSLNDDSATHNFTKLNTEEGIFRKKIQKYKYAIKDNWNIQNLNFLKLVLPTNYSTDEKINFCNNVVSDDIKYHYNIIANCDLSDEIRVKSFQMLIHMGVDNDINILEYVRLKIKIGKYSVDDLIYKLVKLTKNNPQLSLFIDIFDILYQNKTYDMCKYYYNIIKKYEPRERNQMNLMKIKKVHEKMKMIEHIFFKNKLNVFLNKNIKKDKKIFCYYTGFTDEFNGKNYESKVVYGSEIAGIKLCESISKQYNCIILCNTKEFVYHNGVSYVNYHFLEYIEKSYNIEYLVISRFISYVLDADLTNVKNVLFLMHDARVHDMWENELIPDYGMPLFFNFLNKIKKVIFVSNWQKENFLRFCNKQKFKIDDDKMMILNNGINTEKFNNFKKKKNRFIYCSDPSRGLHMLCKIIIKLQQKYKDVTLDIYFHKLPNDLQQIVNKYDFINFHGKIKNDQIAVEFCKNDFWVYPNVNSHETFCISCVEAMCGGNVVITRDFSALPELINKNGILIPKNILGDELVDYVIEKISHIIDNNLKSKIQKEAKQHSLKYDWKNIGKQWIQFLNNF
jgi:glycosyltransferase involved in cell wall biosynthesis